MRSWLVCCAVLAVVGGPAVAEDARPFDDLIHRYATEFEVPASLIHRVVTRESRYNPAARNGPNLGLMQIQLPTATTMGYSGEAAGLLDAETNLRFGVRYLAGAYLVAGGDPDRAEALYRSGYYYQARDRGLLEETGLRPGVTPEPPRAPPEEIAGGLY